MIKIINTISITAASLLLMNPVLAGANSLGEAINLAKVEVNRQLGVSETEIRVVQTQAAEWPNSSLGCPKKGMQYQPVIIPGHLVKIMTATQTYTVHVAGERAVICDGPSGTARQRLPVRDEQVMRLVQLAGYVGRHGKVRQGSEE